MIQGQTNTMYVSTQFVKEGSYRIEAYASTPPLLLQHESHFGQDAENAATDDLRHGAGATAALDIGPGWVPVQEVLDARAQASDARAEAFQAQQHAQEVEEGSRKGLQHLREQVC